MATVPPDACMHVRTSTVTWDEIGGEIVAINLESGHYFSLRHTARDLFVLWNAGAGHDEAATRVGAEDVPEGREEVAAFLDALLAAGLLQVASPGSGQPPPEPVDEPVVVHAYSRPELETFTDLEDLLLLDPVHNVDADGWPHAVVDEV